MWIYKLKDVFDWIILIMIAIFLIFTAEKHWNPVSNQFIANQVKVIILKTDSYLHNVGYLCGYPTELKGDKGEWIVSEKYTVIDYFNLEQYDLVKKEYRACLKDLSKSMAIKTFFTYVDIPSPKYIHMSKDKVFWLGFSDEKLMNLNHPIYQYMTKEMNIKKEKDIVWISKK